MAETLILARTDTFGCTPLPAGRIHAMAACALAAAVAVAGCSAGQDFEECRTTSECGGGLVCSPQRYCVTQADLVANYSLLTERCSFTDGPHTDPQAMLVGVLLPFTGDDSERAIEVGRALNLAREEINGPAVGGIGPRQRPLALVFCDTEGTSEGALDAALHLARFGIPAAIGPARRAPALSVVSEFGVDRGLDPGGLVWLPVAVPSAQVAEQNNPSAWSVAPSDLNWARAMGTMLLQRSDFGLPESGPVLLLHPDTAEGNARRQALTAVGSPEDMTIVAYDPKGQFENGTAALQALKPRTVVLLADSQVANIVAFSEGKSIEFGFSEPISWLLPPEGQTDAIFQVLEDNQKAGLDPEAILGRIQGLRNRRRGAGFDSFRARMEEKFGNGVPVDGGVVEAYDAAYAVALALGVASAREDLASYRPTDVVEGLRRLSSGELVVVGPEGGGRARLLLSGADLTVNLDGACGPMDFTSQGDPGAGPINLWRPVHASRTFAEDQL